MGCFQWIIGGMNNVLNNTEGVTEYNRIYGGYQWNADEVGELNIVPIDTTLKKLIVTLSEAPDPGNSDGYIFTIRKNYVDTGLTVTITGNNTNGSVEYDLNLEPGDRVSLDCYTSGTPSSGSVRARYRTLWEHDEDNIFIIMGCTQDGPLTDGTREFCHLSSGVTWSASEYARRNILPCAGTFKHLHMRISTAPGSGNSWDVDLRKNDADSSLDLNFADSSQYEYDDTTEVSVTAGDWVTIGVVGVSTPAGSWDWCYGIAFIPDNAGECPIMQGIANALEVTTTEWNKIIGYDTWGSAWEPAYYMAFPKCMIKKWYIKLSDSPGAGTSYLFTLRLNGVDTAISITIADTATTGNETTTAVWITEGYQPTVECDPTGTPTSRSAYWGFVLMFEENITDGVFFEEDFEDATYFDGETEEDGTYTPVVTDDTTNPLSGTKNLKAYLSTNWTNSNSLVYEDIRFQCEGGEIWTRAKNVMFTADPEVGEDIRLFACNHGPEGTSLCYFGVRNDGGTLKWFIYKRDGGSFGAVDQSTGDAPVKNTNYEVQIYFKRGNGDGVATLWVNGVQVTTSMGLDNDDRDLNYMACGLCYSDANNSEAMIVYMDDVQMSNSGYISDPSSGDVGGAGWLSGAFILLLKIVNR